MREPLTNSTEILRRGRCALPSPSIPRRMTATAPTSASSTAARSGIRRVLAPDTLGLGPGGRAHSRPLASGRDPAARRQPFIARLKCSVSAAQPRRLCPRCRDDDHVAASYRHTEEHGGALSRRGCSRQAPALQGILRRRRELGSRRTHPPGKCQREVRKRRPAAQKKLVAGSGRMSSCMQSGMRKDSFLA